MQSSTWYIQRERERARESLCICFEFAHWSGCYPQTANSVPTRFQIKHQELKQYRHIQYASLRLEREHHTEVIWLFGCNVKAMVFVCRSFVMPSTLLPLFTIPKKKIVISYTQARNVHNTISESIRRAPSNRTNSSWHMSTICLSVIFARIPLYHSVSHFFPVFLSSPSSILYANAGNIVKPYP